MMQKDQDTKLAENKICSCEQNMKFTSLIISQETVATEWFLIMGLLSVQHYSLQIMMRFGCTSAKTWCACSPDALVNMSCILH